MKQELKRNTPTTRVNPNISPNSAQLGSQKSVVPFVATWFVVHVALAAFYAFKLSALFMIVKLATVT